MASHLETQRRLAHVVERLSEAFPDVPSTVIKDEVRSISRPLILEARFCDYVPVLAYRFARERLEERHRTLRRAA